MFSKHTIYFFEILYTFLLMYGTALSLPTDVTNSEQSIQEVFVVQILRP